MSKIIASDEIEQLVGAARHADRHYARAVAAEQEVYVLHSKACLAEQPDLRKCRFSLALDNGIDDVISRWLGFEDVPVIVGILNGLYLVPLRAVAQ